MPVQIVVAGPLIVDGALLVAQRAWAATYR